MTINRAHSLRSRIILTLCCFSLLLSLVFSGLLVLTGAFTQDYVFDLEVRNLTKQVLDDYLAGETVFDDIPDGFMISIGLDGLSPTVVDALELKKLPAGSYETQSPLSYHYTISDLPEGGNRLYVLYDVSQLESPLAEESVQLIMILIPAVLTTLVGVFIGLLLAGKIISPVRRLAERVRNVEPGHQIHDLAKDFSADEVGELARTIEAYMQRLSAFIAREQEFTRNASHELRTPLAVVKTTAELLRCSNSLQAASDIAALDRIDRAISEMEELVTTFLLLARERDFADQIVRCSIGDKIEQLVDKYAYLFEDKNITCRVVKAQEVTLDVPVRLVEIILGNLIRNAFQHVTEGTVEIRLEDNSLKIINEYSPAPGRSQDLDTMTHGIGHSITARLCHHLGYRFYFSRNETTATATVLFKQ